MDFSFTEEQTLLRNSVARFVADNYTFEARREIVKSAEGWRPDYWKQFAELGLLAAPFAEEHGGLGGGPIETMVILEEFGRGLVVEPYLPTVVIGGAFLRHAGSAAQKEELLPQIVEGSLVTSFAFAEPQARFDLFDIRTSAKKSGGGYTLNGHKSVAIAAPMAGKLIVTARTAGSQRDAKGIGVFLVDATAKGVTLESYPTVDGLRAADVRLDNVAVGADALLGEAENGLPLVERVVDEAIAALSAEAMGVHRKMLELTLDYTKTRQQFGQPISKFQALQHRMADMFVHVEESVSMAYMVALKLDAPEAERKAAAAAAKAQLGRAGRFIGQNAIQLHGGMGMTEEMAVGHYFKRATMMNILFGDADHHTRRFAELTQGAAA